MNAPPHRLALLAAGIALAAVPSLCPAEELVDIAAARPCSSVAGGSAQGNCAVSTSPRGLKVELKAEAGTLDFALPPGLVPWAPANAGSASISVDGLMLYNGSFTPEVWQLSAGDVLQVHLVNALPAGTHAATNLHTHGLLVSPDLDLAADGHAIEPVGDSVYVCTIPPGAAPDSPSAAPCSHHGAIYGASPSEMHYRLAMRPDHPSGLYWYHPHVHTNARAQVGSGLSGLIYVQGSASVSGGVPAGPEPAPTERFLMLKDLQVGNVADAGNGRWTGSFLPVEDDNHGADLCGSRTADAAPPAGACFADQGDAGKFAWLFTVNGQVFPSISVGYGQKEIWRIANVSADMTYDLGLVELGTARPLRVQILARDGVSAAPVGTRTSPMAERILLMPGSRIEIAVDRATADGFTAQTAPLSARLRSYGFFTGGAVGWGDNWPAVDLAAVEFAGRPGPAAALAPHALRRGGPALSGAETRGFKPLTVLPWAPSAPTVAAAAAPPSTPPAMAPGHPGKGGHGTGAPSAAECKPLRSGEERVIVLAIDRTQPDPANPGQNLEKFEIGAARGKPRDPASWQHAIATAKANAAQFGDGSPFLCAHAGTHEVWTILNQPGLQADGTPDPNRNNETHNFHVHQMKFVVLDAVDPNGRILPPRGGAAAGRRVDSYPVPIGGLLHIRVPFTRQQVGGKFVFHCHILEHEDKGMMAEIAVLPH